MVAESPAIRARAPTLPPRATTPRAAEREPRATVAECGRVRAQEKGPAARSTGPFTSTVTPRLRDDTTPHTAYTPRSARSAAYGTATMAVPECSHTLLSGGCCDCVGNVPFRCSVPA